MNLSAIPLIHRGKERVAIPVRALLLALLVLLLIGWFYREALGEPASERVYYFWSFSMPKESLLAAFDDGQKIGAVFVLRGLPEGSAKDGLLRIRQLIGDRKIAVIIDPYLYRLYHVTAVPTLIFAEGVSFTCEHCEPAPLHFTSQGDVSMSHALEQMGRPGADRLEAKLRKGFYQK